MTFESMRGLGPKSRVMIESLGIDNVEAFLAQDPFELYRQLKERFPDTSLNMLYALIGAQEGEDWKVIARERKHAILMRLDDMGLAP